MEPGPPKKRRALGVFSGRSSSISTSNLPSASVVDTWHITTNVHGCDFAGRDGTRPSKKTAGFGCALWKVEFHLDQRPTQRHRCKCWAHNHPSTLTGLRRPGWNPALQKNGKLCLCVRFAAGRPPFMDLLVPSRIRSVLHSTTPSLVHDYISQP